MTRAASFPNANRLTIVGPDGRVSERWDYHGIEVHIQDEGRTVKIFPKKMVDD
jgi:hypothetical protein